MAKPEESVPYWRKSSASSTADCIEVAYIEDVVLVRDSKDLAGPVISVSPESWATFLYNLCASTVSISNDPTSVGFPKTASSLTSR